MWLCVVCVWVWSVFECYVVKCGLCLSMVCVWVLCDYVWSLFEYGLCLSVVWLSVVCVWVWSVFECYVAMCGLCLSMVCVWGLCGYVWSVFMQGQCVTLCVAEDARGPSVQAGLVSPLLMLLKDDQRVQCQIQAGRALGNICYENGKSRLELNCTGRMIPCMWYLMPCLSLQISFGPVWLFVPGKWPYLKLF